MIKDSELQGTRQETSEGYLAVLEVSVPRKGHQTSDASSRLSVRNHTRRLPFFSTALVTEVEDARAALALYILHKDNIDHEIKFKSN